MNLTNNDKSYLRDHYSRMAAYTGVRLSDSQINNRIADIIDMVKVNEKGAIGRRKTTNFAMGINRGNSVDGLLNDSRPGIGFPIVVRDSIEANAMAHVLQDDAQVAQYNIPSSGVPQPLTTIWSTTPIKELYKATRIAQMTDPLQQGVFGVTDSKFPVRVTGGYSQLYNDLSNGGSSTVNYNWIERQYQYFEQNLIYGELQSAEFSLAKIDYVSDLREALSISVNQQQNDLAFNGWYGTGKNAAYFQIFGILNEPNLPPAITFPADGQVPGTTVPTASWLGKNFAQIQRDCRLLFSDVTKKAVGNITIDTVRGQLVLPPGIENYLTVTTDYGISVMDWLKKAYPGVSILSTSNFESFLTPTTTSVIMFLATHPSTGEKPYKEIFVTKYQGFRPFVQSTAIIEKMGYALGGVVLFYPWLLSYAFGV